ncbi:unnamed protein product [Brassica oleracea]
MGDEKESSVTSTVAEQVVEAVGIYIFLYIHKPKLVTLKKDMERGGFHGYGKFSLNNTNPSEPAKFLMAAGSMQLSVFNKPNKTANGGEEECTVREQDRFMPIANVIRIMRSILPVHAKISVLRRLQGDDPRVCL